MDTMNNKTDRFFREKLASFEQSPPDSAWDQIARKTEERKKKRAVMIFFRIAAGMAILLSTGIGVYMLNRPQEISVAQAANEAPETIVRQSAPISDDVNIPPADLSSKDQAQLQAVNTTNPAIIVKKQKELIEIFNLAEDNVTNDNPALENITLSEIPITGNDQIFTEVPADTAKTLTPEEAAALILAQNSDVPEEPVTSKIRRWNIGSEIAPLYSNRHVQSPQYDNAVSELNSSESGILAYAGGISVGMSAGKRLTVQSGLYYSRYGQQINEVHAIDATIENPNNYRFITASNSTGNIEGVLNPRSDVTDINELYYKADLYNGITSPDAKPLVQSDVQDIEIKQFFNYFELPLIVKYKIIDRKMDFSFSGGFITNFMVGNTVNLVADGTEQNIGETSDISQINYLGSFGLGFEMPIAENFSFTLEPRFRYYINQFDRSEDISVHPYSLGFFAGVNYRF